MAQDPARLPDVSDEESKGERLDRELNELLQELRVVLPGVQVLLAFLLTAPFQQRFAQLPGTLRNAFFASIACATVATALLIAPSAHHRLRWREREKERLLRIANREAIWGTVFLAAAIVLALYVITDVLFATWIALLTAAAAVAVFALLWYALPLFGSSSREEPPG
jgi:Kef-type K+ transport system membrane component KefB